MRQSSVHPLLVQHARTETKMKVWATKKKEKMRAVLWIMKKWFISRMRM